MREALLSAVSAGDFDVVWLGTPCASFSILWLEGDAQPPRSRAQPDGVDGLPSWQRRYLDLHNAFVSFSKEVALATFEAGGTYVIENPVDYGYRVSPHFRWAARAHCPLWLATPMRRLAEATRPSWASGTQCGFGGDFKKPTTLMSAGPKARRLRSFNELRCTHASHARSAVGVNEAGRNNSADAAAYPPLMCAWVMRALFGAEPVPAAAPSVLSLPSSASLLEAVALATAANLAAAATFSDDRGMGGASLGGGSRGEYASGEGPDPRQPSGVHEVHTSGGAALFPANLAWTRPRWPPRGASLLAAGGGLGTAVVSTPAQAWRAAPEAMPASWPEHGDVRGPAAEEARAQALRYISRRRTEPESAEVLASRPFEDPHPTPILAARQPSGRVPWPIGAPPRPIHIASLYYLGVYDEILEAVDGNTAEMDSAAAAIAGGATPKHIAKRATRVFKPEECQPEWARRCVWDTLDVDDCVPVQPNSADDRPDHPVNHVFFSSWARFLGWQDLDMVEQVVNTGVEGRAELEWSTVVMSHHGGLRSNPKPAFDSVAKDTAAGWMTTARRDLLYVPSRLVPKNVVSLLKWRVDEATRELISKVKHRVTTDDSVVPVDGDVATDSRNTTIDREAWGDAKLTGPRTLAEALAIVKSVGESMGITASAAAWERIALWAIDLSDAYRALAEARSERWQQCFCWAGGVKVDLRCVFGAAHMVDFFQRVSTFVLAVATHRVRAYDTQHPYSGAREAWRAWREDELGERQDVTFHSIYIDDGSGLVPLAAGEPLRGAAPGSPAVLAGVGVEPSVEGGVPRVQLRLYVGKSRPQIHLSIVKQTFLEAGWSVADDKEQLGFVIDSLGLALSSEGDGCVFTQEAKRRAMLLDIDAQLDATDTVERAAVEKLTGRCSFTAQVVCEGNAHLHPLYRFQNARWDVKGADGVTRKAKPLLLSTAGHSHTQLRYREALAWWRAVLSTEVTVPLAPRLVFPAIGEEGCAFFFTDAARESGTGYGAYSVVIDEGVEAPFFLFHENRWRPDALAALQADLFSMPAGECFGAVVFADALLRELGGATHLVCFTDSAATATAFTTGGSGAPQLHFLITWLIGRWPGTQFLGIHQPGVRNDAADALSRTAEGRAWVLAEAAAAGATICELRPPSGEIDALLELAMACPLRR